MYCEYLLYGPRADSVIIQIAENFTFSSVVTVAISVLFCPGFQYSFSCSGVSYRDACDGAFRGFCKMSRVLTAAALYRDEKRTSGRI